VSGTLLGVRDRAVLRGVEGGARQLAMEVIVEMARLLEAPRLIDIESAHIDGCLPFGQVALDWPARLLALGGRVAVPTTLNVSALDLLHPERPSGDPAVVALGRQIAVAYEELGCRPTWTCAPYQLPERPGLGSHVAWAESNAIVFANSVLGARTSRYGDFFDICAALTGRVPEAGLHVTANRRARAVFELGDLSDAQRASDLLYPLLGTFIGERTGARVPAIVGLSRTASEDQLKALGAAAASSGAVAMFHAVGVTPEAATLDDALQGQPPDLVEAVTAADLRMVRAHLGTGSGGRLTAVALGTPHFSLSEFDALRGLLAGRRIHPGVRAYVSTARETYARLVERGWLSDLEDLGVEIVTDTCTYLRPMLDFGSGIVLTNSAKWAWYAPMTVGVDVMLGSLAECVASAVSGHLELDDGS
jgi:predicted aconitase